MEPLERRENGSLAGLFAGLDQREVDAVTSAAAARTVAAGEEVLRRGEESWSLFIVASGRMKVTREVGGEVVPIATIGPGQTFGEMAVVTGGRRTATLAAEEAGEVLELSRERLEDLFEEHPRLAGKFWLNVARILAERVIRTNDLVAEYVSINRRLIEDPDFFRFYSQL